MRPCKACGAAMQNNAEVCPECGAAMPLRTNDGPPPETGPGISGGPEERAEMIGLLVFPLVFALVAGTIACDIWGPWGIVVGILAGAVAFMVRLCLELL